MTREEQPQPAAQVPAAETPTTSAQVAPGATARSASPPVSPPGAPGTLDVVPAGTPGEHARALLRVRGYRRLWTTQLLGGVADRLALLVVVALVVQAGVLSSAFGGGYRGDAVAVAVALAVRLAATVLFGAVLLGPLHTLAARRLDPRWTLFGCDVLRAALLGIVPWWVVWTGQRAVIWLLVTVFVAGAVDRLWSVTKDAAAPALLPAVSARRPEAARPTAGQLETLRRIDLLTGWATVPLGAAALVVLTLLDNLAALGLGWLDSHQETAAALGAAVLFAVSALLVQQQELPRPQEAVSAAGPGADRPAAPAEAEAAPVRQPARTRPRSPLQGLRAPSDASGPVVSRGRTGSAPFFTLGLAVAYAALAATAAVALQRAYDLGAGPVGYGLLVLAATGAPALGMVTAHRTLVTLSRRRLFPVALSVAGTALIVAGLVPDYVLAVVMVTVAGITAGTAVRVGRDLIDQESDEGRRPRVTEHVHAVLRAVTGAALVVAPLVAAGIGTPAYGWGDGGLSLHHRGAGLAVSVTGLLVLLVGVGVLLRTDDRRGAAPVYRDLWDALRGGPAPVPHRAGTGYFIALEGGDGAGKSTQAQALAEWIRSKGHEVVLTREPGGSPVGQRLRSMLLDVGNTGISHRAEALLYAADRAEHVESVIRPALERGAVVISDRYTDSSVAYQGAGRDLSAAGIARVSRWATGGLVPDLTVLLDLPPETARERFGEALDRLESEPGEFHDRVRRGYLALAAADPVRYLVVDASQPAHSVTTAIRHRLDRELPLSEQEKAARAEQERLAREEAERRAAEEARRRAEAEQAERDRQRLLERLRMEEEERERERRAEEDRRAAEEARRRAEEARRRAAEEARRRAEEEERRREEQAARRRAAEEERARTEAEAARVAEFEEQRRAQRAEQRRRAEEALADERRARGEAVDPAEDPTAELPQPAAPGRDPDAEPEAGPGAGDGEPPSDERTLRLPRVAAGERTVKLPRVTPGEEETTRLPRSPRGGAPAPDPQVPSGERTVKLPRAGGTPAAEGDEGRLGPAERTREMPVVDPEARPGRRSGRGRPEWAEETPLDDLPTLADELLGPRGEWGDWAPDEEEAGAEQEPPRGRPRGRGGRRD